MPDEPIATDDDRRVPNIGGYRSDKPLSAEEIDRELRTAWADGPHRDDVDRA
ncbi:hypothetical protein [Nocardia sp. SSK8]|uniref:hypothetical protein n=1 Tax=Nocardia sp. SSK8 TaxID=3120154 RepID=UPI00300850F1